MYEYTLHRTLEEMLFFVREGYLHTESEKIPKSPSLMKTVGKSLREMVKKMKDLMINEPIRAAIVFAALGGFVIVMFLGCIWFMKPEKQAIPTPAVESKTTKKPKTN